MTTTIVGPAPSGAWAAIRGIATTVGEFDSCYIPGDNGHIVVFGPTGPWPPIPFPRMADWRLTVVDGKLVIVASQYTDTQFKDKVRIRVTTDIAAGEIAGALVTGPATTQGAGMTDAQFAELKAMLANIAAGTDGMWRDVVGRLKAHDGKADGDIAAVIGHVTSLPERVLRHPAAPDHFGLDSRARFADMLQESLAIMFSNQAFLQVFLETLFEAAGNLKTHGFDPLAPK